MKLDLVCIIYKRNVVTAIQVVGRVNGFHLKKFVVSDSRHESSGSGIEGPDKDNIDPVDMLDLTSASDCMSDRNESSNAVMEKESLSNPEDTLDLPPLPSPMPSLSQLIRKVSTIEYLHVMTSH